MALTDRNIVITPQGPLGLGASEPTIRFTGATASTSASTYIRVLDTGAVSNEGPALGYGQAQLIQDGPSSGSGGANTLYSVTDRSGIPSIEVFDNGAINIGRYQGTVYLGNNIASTNTTSGSLQILGGVGVSGNLNIGGSFAMNANLGVGGAGATYGLTVSTTTNVAAFLSNAGNSQGVSLQVGASTYPLGIGFNSYNNVGTTYVMGTGYNAQLQLIGGTLTFNVSSASQSAGAIATQLQGLSVSSTGILVPQSTAITVTSGVASTGTGAIITYGGISAGGGIVTAGDAYHNGVRVGIGSGNISSNTVLGNAAGANLLTGGSNLLIGYQAGNALTSAGQNVAIGYQSMLLQQATGGANTAIGYQSMYSVNNTAMTNNTAIGYRAMGLGNGGFYANTGIGYYALANVTGGYNNVAIGYNAGNSIAGGFQNTVIGYGAGSALGGQSNVVVIGGATGSSAVNNAVIVSDGAGNIRISFDGSGNASIPATTAANGTTGVGALTVGGGASIASGLTLGGALYVGNSAGTNGYFLQSTGTGLQWAQAAMTIANITTNAVYYPVFTNSVSGTVTTEYVDSSHLLYNPSTGILTAGGFLGPLNGTVGATTANSGNFTTLAGTQLTITNGGTTHAITGPLGGALTLSNGGTPGTGVCLTVGGSGDINITTGGGLFFGNYSYATGTSLRGNGGGEWYLYRTGSPVIQSNGAGAVQVNGTLYITGDAYTNYSDSRLKNVIAPITGAVAKIRQLEGFIYTASDLALSLGQGKEGQVRVGLSAQSVQKVQPEAVGLAGFDVDENGNSKSGENYLSVQYEKLVPLLTEGVKENADEIDALKAEIAQLKELVARLLK